MNLLVVTSHDRHKPYDSSYAIPRAFSSNFPTMGVYTTSLDVSTEHFEEATSIVDFVEVDERFSFGNRHRYYNRDRMQRGDIADFDIVFFRVDQILDAPGRVNQYLEFAGRVTPNTRYINSPTGLITTSSKKFLEHFPELCPHFRIVRSLGEALEEATRFPVVLKPLNGTNGHGILKIVTAEEISVEGEDKKGQEAVDFLRSLPETYFPVIAMRFLENVTQGDKRVVVAAGVCLGAVLRVPQRGSWMANVAQGAQSRSAEPDRKELEMIERIDPVLRNAGITVYGIDTLVDDDGKRVLSEINTLNVGGLVQIQARTNRPVLGRLATLAIGQVNGSALRS